MSLDYDALLYDPLYAAFGVAATLDLGTAGQFTLTVIDKTAGVLLDEGHGLSFVTTKPAACVRMSELAENDLTRASVKGAGIAFNNGTWTIVATQPKPNPSGDGELYLILQEV
jgi:hypothetical protein